MEHLPNIPINSAQFEKVKRLTVFHRFPHVYSISCHLKDLDAGNLEVSVQLEDDPTSRLGCLCGVQFFFASPRTPRHISYFTVLLASANNSFYIFIWSCYRPKRECWCSPCCFFVDHEAIYPFFEIISSTQKILCAMNKSTFTSSPGTKVSEVTLKTVTLERFPLEDQAMLRSVSQKTNPLRDLKGISGEF